MYFRCLPPVLAEDEPVTHFGSKHHFFQKNGCNFNHHRHGKLWIPLLIKQITKTPTISVSFRITGGELSKTSHGSCRHHGFVPWDGDADVCVTRAGRPPPKKRWSGFPQGPNCGKPGNFLGSGYASSFYLV